MLVTGQHSLLFLGSTNFYLYEYLDVMRETGGKNNKKEKQLGRQMQTWAWLFLF